MTGTSPPRVGVGSERGDGGRLPYNRWFVVAASATMLMFGAGLSFYAFPVYMDELVRQDEASLSTVSNSVSVFYFAFAFAGVPVAALIRRVDTRWVIAVGALAAGGGLALVAVGTQPWHLAAALAVLGVGSSATTVIPCTTVIVALFDEQRTKALALTMTGFSVGGVAVAPVVAAVVHSHGLSTCAPWLALAYVVLVGGPGTAFVSSRYASTAASPRVVAVADAAAAGLPSPVRDVRYRQAVASWTFVVLAGSCAVLMGNQMGPQVHLVRLGTERGLDNPVLLITVLATSSLVGRLVGGVILSRVLTVDFLAALGIVQAGALVLLGTSTSTWGAAAGASLFGICVGNLGVVMPLLLVDRYGLTDYSRVFGLHQLVVNLGMAAGPGLVGWMRDEAGTYPIPMLVLATASAASAVLIVAVLRPSHARPAPRARRRVGSEE
jgi:MFS family permease